MVLEVRKEMLNCAEQPGTEPAAGSVEMIETAAFQQFGEEVVSQVAGIVTAVGA